VENVYAAARQWVEEALLRDGSLFTPGKPIWSSQVLGEIRERFLNRPDASGASFYDKMENQLAGTSPDVIQLMSEALYVHFLVVWHGAMKSSTKRSRINQMLGWSKQPVVIPDGLADSLTPGIANPGTAFNTFRPFQVGFLIEFAENWKSQTPSEQERLLSDPWAFKEFLWFSPSSTLFSIYDSDGPYRIQREALLHLVFPDTFEGIVSVTHKAQIVRRFTRFITVETDDVDRQLEAIRLGLENELGRDFSYYDEDIRIKWDPDQKRVAWDKFVAAAQMFLALYDLGKEQIDYKTGIATRLSTARAAVLAGEDNWRDLLEKAFGDTHSIIYYQVRRKFLDWVQASPGPGLKSLQRIWVQHASPLHDRILSFNKLLPQSVIGGTGTRTNVASALLMGLDAERYPPFNIRLFNDAYDLTGHDRAAKHADEATSYEHALAFLDQFITEASERGLQIGHRLAAQSLVWVIVKNEPPFMNGDPNGAVKTHTGTTLLDLADELLLPIDFLEEIEILLKGKGQIIFQGPPGTGKTYVAQRLAEHLAGSKDRVTLVQFHPSYAYEDFVQGYRPSLLEGQPGFELKDGPLLQAALRAEEDSDGDHYLVIDEINRGNLAKVFGELYFLLEYRKEGMRLQYQADKEFSLPENLYIIGTMNTADRSIALVDLALRRRFYFVEFHPDDEPIKGLLRNWLREKASNMEWVADVIDLVNKKLEDRHVAIGPSYFMGTDEEGNAVVTDETAVRRIWKHSVLPYTEEHLLGNLDGIQDEWDLDKLRQEGNAPKQENDGEEENSSQADASD